MIYKTLPYFGIDSIYMTDLPRVIALIFAKILFGLERIEQLNCRRVLKWLHSNLYRRMEKSRSAFFVMYILGARELLRFDTKKCFTFLTIYTQISVLLQILWLLTLYCLCNSSIANIGITSAVGANKQGLLM